MVITLYTKLVTRATQVKRKQACKTDIVSSGYENPGKEKKGKQVRGGGVMGRGPKSLLRGEGAELRRCYGRGCLLRGKLDRTKRAPRHQGS